MSLNLTLGRREKPRQEKPKRKHRADDRIAELNTVIDELRADNAKLLNRQAEADDYFALLQHDITVTNQGWQQEKERRQLAEKALQQAEAVIRLRDQRITELARRLAVGVLAEAAAAETQPIPVITPVIPLHQSPLAKPTHVPAWATTGQTDPAA